MFWEVLDERRNTLLKKIVKNMPVKNSYLAGGTAIALQLGHRISYDFDWLTPEIFNPEKVSAELEAIGALKNVSISRGTFHGTLEDIRVTWLHYPNPLLKPLVESPESPGLKIASLEDLGLMKIVAISSHGAKRDFYDLYRICKFKLNLKELIKIMPQKYPYSEVNLYHLIKSLTYFEDAEHDPTPDGIENISWPEVKEFFTTHQPYLLELIKNQEFRD